MSTAPIPESQITLQRLRNTPKTQNQVFDLLRHQPIAHYQSWATGGEVSLRAVRDLLGSNPVFGIILNDKQLVGLIGFKYKANYFIPLFNGQMWLHYIVDKAYNGRGIATAAIKKFFKLICEETQIRRIYAGIYSDNPTSQHVVKKFGFVRQGGKADVEVFEKRINCAEIL